MKNRNPNTRLRVVYYTLRFLVVLSAIRQFFLGDYNNVFICFLTLLLFMLPSLISRKFNLELLNTLEIIILLLSSRLKYWVKSTLIT